MTQDLLRIELSRVRNARSGVPHAITLADAVEEIRESSNASTVAEARPLKDAGEHKKKTASHTDNPKAKPFDFDGDAKLGSYVRLKKYSQGLGNSAMHLYFALSYLEQRGLGLCKPITANYRQIAAAAFLSPTGLKKQLKELSGVLCDERPG